MQKLSLLCFCFFFFYFGCTVIHKSGFLICLLFREGGGIKLRDLGWVGECSFGSFLCGDNAFVVIISIIGVSSLF